MLFIDALPLVPNRRSGIGHYIELLVRGLDELHAPYTLFVPTKKAHLLRNRYPSTPIVELPFPMRFLKLFDFLHILPAIDRWCGVGTYFFGNFENFPLSSQSRSITCIHDMAFRRYPQTIEWRNALFFRLFMKRWIKRTDVLATVSRFSANEIRMFFKPKGDIHVVHNAVDTRRFRPQPASSAETVLKKYSVTARNYLLFVGNLEPRKGLETFLEWYRQQPAEWRSKQPLLLIGGDGWRTERVQRLISELNAETQCIFRPKGYVTDEDLPAFYALSKLCLLPSIYEGYGVPVVEATACAKPVALSAITPLADLVADLELQAVKPSELSLPESFPLPTYQPSSASASKIITPRQAAEELVALLDQA